MEWEKELSDAFSAMFGNNDKHRGTKATELHAAIGQLTMGNNGYQWRPHA